MTSDLLESFSSMKSVEGCDGRCMSLISSVVSVPEAGPGLGDEGGLCASLLACPTGLCAANRSWEAERGSSG